MEYAGFWRRVGAYIIDFLIVGLVTGLLSGVLGLNATTAIPVDPASADAMTQVTGNPTVNLLSFLLGVAYFAGLESSTWQATVGKKALGMVVTDLAGNRISFMRALGRYLAKFLSAIILLIGFIMVAFTERKQGLHDLLAKTLVVVGNPAQDRGQVFE